MLSPSMRRSHRRVLGNLFSVSCADVNRTYIPCGEFGIWTDICRVRRAWRRGKGRDAPEGPRHVVSLGLSLQRNGTFQKHGEASDTATCAARALLLQRSSAIRTVGGS